MTYWENTRPEHRSEIQWIVRDMRYIFPAEKLRYRIRLIPAHFDVSSPQRVHPREQVFVPRLEYRM